MSLENRPRFRRPLQSDIERIKLLIEDNLPLTTCKIIDNALLKSFAICMALEKLINLEYGSHIEQHTANDHHMHNFLLSKRNRHRFLQRIVIDDEKWLLCVEHTCKRQWVNPEDFPEPEPKNDLHQKQVMLSIW